MGLEVVFIGFGSNVGDRQEWCDRAVTLMGLLPHSRLTGVSSYYETQPVGSEDILGATWFYNGVIRIETNLAPHSLLDILRETEQALGRDDSKRQGPRTMDFDILFYGKHTLQQSGLSVPHPRLHLRRFVLEPLAELDPDWVHPVFNQTVHDLLNVLDDPSEVRKLNIVPGSRYGMSPSCSLPSST